ERFQVVEKGLAHLPPVRRPPTQPARLLDRPEGTVRRVSKGRQLAVGVKERFAIGAHHRGGRRIARLFASFSAHCIPRSRLVPVSPALTVYGNETVRPSWKSDRDKNTIR